jgi:hypothetical protein
MDGHLKCGNKYERLDLQKRFTELQFLQLIISSINSIEIIAFLKEHFTCNFDYYRMNINVIATFMKCNSNFQHQSRSTIFRWNCSSANSAAVTRFRWRRHLGGTTNRSHELLDLCHMTIRIRRTDKVLERYTWETIFSASKFCTSDLPRGCTVRVGFHGCLWWVHKIECALWYVKRTKRWPLRVTSWYYGDRIVVPTLNCNSAVVLIAISQ